MSGMWRLRAFKAFARYPIKKKPDGLWITTPMGTFHCASFASLVQFDEMWEREVRETVGDLEGRLFMDIGANIGFYSVLAARNRNYVVAVEPDKKAYLALQDNIDANGLSARIEAHNVAAWSDNAQVLFKPGKHHDTGSVSDTGVPVRAVSVDTLLDGRVPSMIKIDAEGAEPEILRGMPDTLDARPRIVFEALSQKRLDECRALLQGFRITRLDRANYLAS